MKNTLTTLAIVFASFSYAQNIGINSTGAIANASALLDVDAAPGNNVGMLIPRISLSNVSTYAPITGTSTASLIVYNTNLGVTNGNGAGYYYWSGTQWIYIPAPSNGPGSSGQVLKSNGAGAAPTWQADANSGGTVTSVTASSPLSSSGGATPNITITSPLPIVNGGTAGTATPTAGAAAYGTGTAYGFTAAGTNGQVLTSAGAGVPTWTTPASGGITGSCGLGANYVPKMSSTTAITCSQIFDNGTNVGIGTINPVLKLEVASGRIGISGPGAGSGEIIFGTSFTGGVPTWHIDQADGNDRFRIFRQPDIFTSGTEFFTILNNGRVGIGTQTPGTLLDVMGNIKIGNGTGARNDFPYLNISTNSGSNRRTAIQFWQNASPLFELGTDVMVDNTQTFYIYDNVAAANRIWINSLGNVGIGPIQPAAKLDVSNTGGNPTAAIIRAGTDGATFFSDWPSGWGGGLATWDICGASTYMSNYVTRSDERYKRNILNLSDALENISKLRPVSYYLVDSLESDKKSKLHFGFIAQEIEKVFPNLVVSSANGMLGMNYMEIIPILTKSIQEQQKMINSQNIRISKLEEQLSRMVKK